ncbi:hypothetical protein MtrunA17_Chr3g0086561 [Medicago truncatula]|uniref:Dentin sialophosphoprotein-like protein, putative n=1 Tax=Medicago truncatula TaxID=3880 RepID=A0A072UU19_MEDTR|nr:uncharacterized protein LOC25488699 isoform X1 [Medicago truncatula]KEH33142.1 dentin sialophosphoprotein-like protein, putative [Medicago truncatula]RHN66050.1 hypothetical protein MtrunA17_Chr3g0086561 [Medicago truncatula]
MPGNEAVDRVHNFFGQENLSQGQYHSQAVDGNWPGISNNLWVGSQGSTGVPFISNLKNFNQQQSDSEQGHISSPHLRHSLNLSQSNLRPESGRNQMPNQQAAVSGYMQGQQVFQTRHNGANIMGMDTESHVNFDFFGGQQQVSGHQNGMLQPLPRQHSGINEMNLLQQQAILNQMQEQQRHQQFHKLEAKQQNSMAPDPSISKQTVKSHSASPINGIPVNEASNFMWQPDVMPTNANWLHRGASPVMHGSSNGLMLSPEQGQALRMMGLVHNQGDQSLYGVPIPGSGGAPNLYFHTQADKPAMPQVSFPQQYSHVHGNKPALPHIAAGSNSFPVHQYGAFSDQINTNDGTLVSRHDNQGKSMFGPTAHAINSRVNVENLQQGSSEQRIVPMQDFHGRQELAGSSEMSSQDKMLVQVPPSQNVATLDPTEEKILFGSDDSLWDGFGMNTGDFNMLDGTDSSSGFPSLQSGSWSALMQSAVAETSSSDMGIQEEWSGLGFQNMGQTSGKEQPSTTDVSKRQPLWADNNLQSPSNINSRPFVRPDDVSRPTTTENHCSVSGFHQSGLDTSDQQHDRSQTDSQRPIPQNLERGRWLDCSPQQKQISEGGHIYGNATNSSVIEKNEKVISDYWTHQPNISSCSGSGGPFSKSNGWDITKSAPFDSSSTFKTHENDKSLQHHHEKAMHEEMSQVPATWEPDSDTNLSVGSEHVKSTGNMQICREDSGVNGIAASPNSGPAWLSRQSSEKLPNVDVWRDAESAGSYKRNEVPGKYKHHMENPLILESSKNGKFESDADKADNSNKKEKSADGLGSNPSHSRDGCTRENANFDGNDLHSPKSSGQVHQRSSITRKVQYHPMGDLGVDVEHYGNNQVINSQPMNHQHLGGLADQGHSYNSLGQSKYGHCDRNDSETEKGDSESLDNNVSKSVLPTQIPKAMTSMDRSVGNYALQKTALPRVPEIESSDGFAVHPQWNRSYSSQGFSLQLAPPTQGPAMVFSRGSLDSGLTTPHMSETGDRGHTKLATNQTFPSQESSPGENRNNVSSTTGQVFDMASHYNVVGNIPQAFTSGFPFSKNHTQNQIMAHLGGQVANNQSASLNQIDEYGERAQASRPEMVSTQDMSMLSGTDQIRLRDRAIQILAAESGSQPSGTYGASLHGTPSKVIHNLWTSVSSRQHPNTLKVPSQPKQNDCEMKADSKNLGDQGQENDGNEFPAIGGSSAYSNSSVQNVLKEIPEQRTLSENAVGDEEVVVPSHLKEHVVKCVSDASQPSLAATSINNEALGRSLRPNNVLNHNFSLLGQVQSMRNMEIDPSNREAKRLKVSDNMDKQQVDSNYGQQLSYVVKDASGNNSSIPSNISHLSAKPHDGHDTNATSQEVIGDDQENYLNVSDSNKAISTRSGHSLINPQMAPSWFEQYGTFKNGATLPIYEAQKITATKMDQPFIIPNQSDSLHFQNSTERVNSLGDAQLGSTRHCPMLASVGSENVCSQLSIPMGEPDLHNLRPKKRKSATSELLSWHKELTQGSERLRDLSEAELLWAQTANRLIEKVEGGAGVVENLSATVKSKRRLVLTTQLMQQLLNPPPAAVLVEDAKVHHESVVYSVSRSTLGEAFSSISWSGCDTLPPGSKNLLPKKRTSSDNVDHCIFKVMDFAERTRKLEDDILRLDGRASILDLRVECQDLERFSVINRFAKFHARGQHDGAETSSSSDASANFQRLFPLKIVNAVPLPRNLPDRVQCLSL